MRRAVMVMAVLVMAGAGLAAQAAPNFAGKWTIADPAAAAGGGRGGMGGLGQEAVVTQDATSLTVTRNTQMGEFKSVYKLDGSESKNTLNMQGNAIDQLSKAKWDGGKLIVNTSMNFSGQSIDTSMTIWLDAAGLLVVETTRPDMQGGGAPITTKTSYKKS